MYSSLACSFYSELPVKCLISYSDSELQLGDLPLLCLLLKSPESLRTNHLAQNTPNRRHFKGECYVLSHFTISDPLS